MLKYHCSHTPWIDDSDHGSDAPVLIIMRNDVRRPSAAGGEIELAVARVFIRHIDDNGRNMREILPSSVRLVYRRGCKGRLRIQAHGETETIDLVAPRLYMHSQAFFGRHSIVVKTGDSAIELRVSNKDDATALMNVLKSYCQGQFPAKFRHSRLIPHRPLGKFTKGVQRQLCQHGMLSRDGHWSIS